MKGLVEELTDFVDMYSETQSGPAQELITGVQEILARAKAEAAHDDKSGKHLGIKVPCDTGNLSYDGPCPYADKNRCIPCNYVPINCPAVTPLGKESLAELADRKGYRVDLVAKINWWWIIGLCEKILPRIEQEGHRVFGNEDELCKTYAEAESKARAYLEGLPDKEAR